MKKCPFCAEDIQDAAIVCRYCNRNLAPAAVLPQTPKRKLNRALIVVLALVGIVAVAAVVFVAIPLVSVDKNLLYRGDTFEPEAEQLKFFVRPELGGLRVTNDTDQVLNDCEVTIAGRYTRTETFLKHGAEVLGYDSFRANGDGLDPSEGFARAQAGGVTIRCGGREIVYGRH